MAGSKPYRVHREVWLEIEAGDDWYLERSVDASAAFIAALADAFESHFPSAPALAQIFARNPAVRASPLSVSIIYLDDPGELSVVAVAHSKRKPGYWKVRH
jgi:toxin ParE1/3/4